MHVETVRKELIEYWKTHLSDLIPYNTPNYEQVLQMEAEQIADKELEPVLKRNKQND